MLDYKILILEEVFKELKEKLVELQNMAHEDCPDTEKEFIAILEDVLGNVDSEIYHRFLSQLGNNELNGFYEEVKTFVTNFSTRIHMRTKNLMHKTWGIPEVTRYPSENGTINWNAITSLLNEDTTYYSAIGIFKQLNGAITHDENSKKVVLSYRFVLYSINLHYYINTVNNKFEGFLFTNEKKIPDKTIELLYKYNEVWVKKSDIENYIKIIRKAQEQRFDELIIAKQKAINIDFDFMEVVEGFRTDGYVPDYDRSGVTIAQGFDIGQHNEFELRNRLFTNNDKMDKRLIEKYLPYVELQRGDADKALLALPVTITADEAARTIDAVKDYNVYKLKNKYTSITTGNFIDLPAQAQTVLFSVAFQHGINSETVEGIIKPLHLGDYSGVVEILEEMAKINYTHRRRLEATLLNELVVIGAKENEK